MLSTRGRKDVDAKDVKVKVIVEAFDILYLNGKVKILLSAYRTSINKVKHLLSSNNVRTASTYQ